MSPCEPDSTPGGARAAVTDRPKLVHYRVLYGPPRHAALKNHLLRLVDLHRAPGTLHLGVVGDLLRDGERFICGSELATVVVLPSLSSLTNFDTGLHVTDPEVAHRYLAHVRQAFLSSDALTSRRAVEALQVVR
jgi:hypothetical protein